MDQAERLRNLVQQQNASDTRAKIIPIVSGKGGVGKSCIAVNLALSLSKLGKQVLIIDGDLGLSNIEVMLGIRTPYNLADYINKGKLLEDIIFKTHGNIHILSCGQGILNITTEQILRLIHELDHLFDIVLIDTGAGISDDVLNFIGAGNEAILVITPEPASITSSYVLLKLIKQKTKLLQDSSDTSLIKVIANKTNNLKEGHITYDKLAKVVKNYLKIPMEFLGYLQYDSIVFDTTLQQKSMLGTFPNSPYSTKLVEMAQYLVSNEI